MCMYCEKGKYIEERAGDNIFLEIYGKHLRVIGRVLNIPIGRDIIIEYCPMCRKEAGRVNKKEYSIYKGEKEIFVGTIEQVIQHFGVKRKTVYFWVSPANIKRADTGNRPGRKPRKKERSGVKIAIRLWEEEQC